MKEYITVLSPSAGEYEEKRSRFLSRLVSCESPEQASEIMQCLRQEYWDARHIVYSYILSDGSSRFSDDGEPHGTAGKPVFDVLSGSGICNALLSVTRYFGGTLLGTGGLVRAYSAAARAAVETAEKVIMCPCTVYSVSCSYAEHKTLCRLIGECGGSIENTDFAVGVTVNAAFKANDKEGFLKKLCEAFSAKVSAREIKNGYSAFPVK